MEGSVAHKAWWGPRIWRILHSLAEVSEGRSDAGIGWRAVVRTTAAILPCAICREHFGNAMAPVRMPSGVRHALWAAHAATGGGLPEAELGRLYGVDLSGGRTAGAICDGAAAGMTEVTAEFRRANVLDRFRVGHLLEWERAVSGLIRLLRFPPASALRTGSQRARTTPASQAGSQRTTPSPREGRQAGPSGGTPAGSQASPRGRPTPRDRRRA
jgi:hypothetical protein